MFGVASSRIKSASAKAGSKGWRNGVQHVGACWSWKAQEIILQSLILAVEQLRTDPHLRAEFEVVCTDCRDQLLSSLKEEMAAEPKKPAHVRNGETTAVCKVLLASNEKLAAAIAGSIACRESLTISAPKAGVAVGPMVTTGL